MQTKFELGQKVYILEDNVIHRVTVQGIHLSNTVPHTEDYTLQEIDTILGVEDVFEEPGSLTGHLLDNITDLTT